MTTSAEIDRILSSKDDTILPSSGMVASVVEAIRSEASTPAPIPFPWKGALPGLVALCVAVACLIALILNQHHNVEVTPPFTISLPRSWANAIEVAGWSILALALSLVSVKLSIAWKSR